MLASFGGALEARQIDAGNGPLTADVTRRSRNRGRRARDSAVKMLMVATAWHGPSGMFVGPRTGRLLTTNAPIPGVGWPWVLAIVVLVMIGLLACPNCIAKGCNQLPCSRPLGGGRRFNSPSQEHCRN
jgi:hypothetical protein